MILIPIAAAALTAAAGAGVLVPFAQPPGGLAVRRLADPQDEERRRLLRTLRELDEERAEGSLTEAEYQTLRAEAEQIAVALLRAQPPRDAAGELAAAMKTERHRERKGRVGPGVLVGTVLAAAIIAVAIPVLSRGVSNRSAGGLITGDAPAAAQRPSLALFEQRVSAHPDDVSARLDLAQRYLDAGSLQKATDQYLIIAQLDPKNVEAHTRIAAALLQARLPDQALKSVGRALQLDPGYPEALYLQGVILLNGMQRPADAAAAFRAYLAAAPFGAHRDEIEALLKTAR